MKRSYFRDTHHKSKRVIPLALHLVRSFVVAGPVGAGVEKDLCSLNLAADL